MYFTPSRDDGLRRLKDFIPAAGIKYAQGRNYDRGADAHKSVSQLSPTSAAARSARLRF